jgi:hypothetical protein
MRKRWLQEMRDISASSKCVTDPLPVIFKAFIVLLEDTRLYGPEGMTVSANVAIASGNGTDVTALRFVAATENDEMDVVGKTLTWTDPGVVSFSAVNEGKPIHVKSIFKHGGVTLFKGQPVTEV